MNKPLVSVVMPAYNCEDFIHDAIKSVLNQSYSTFELVIVDDSSTDNTVEIIKSFCDSRIKFIQHDYNQNISATINSGIKIAVGKYIARLDADDLMLENRLMEQVIFMEKNLSVGVLGSYVDIFGSSNRRKRYPLRHQQLVRNMQFISPFCHSAVMIKKSILPPDPYNSEFSGMDDLDLWWRLATKTKFATIPIVLTRYRFHQSATSTVRFRELLLQSSWYRFSRTNNLLAKFTMMILILIATIRQDWIIKKVIRA